MLQTEQYPEFDPSIAQEFGYSDTGNTLDFLGVPLFEADSLFNLLIRFTFNLLICWVIVHFFYYKKSRRRDYYTTFILFSVSMFLLIFLMENVKLQIGFTLGLFAIFGMIRYRTETVPIREMTYLFVIIAISVINGLAMTVSYAELVVTNLLIIAMTGICEHVRLRHTASKLVLYDKSENIVPERRAKLITDLEQRIGKKKKKVDVGHVDFLRDAAFLRVYYICDKNTTGDVENITKIKPDMS